ncbi:WecB/TagA/CpsF family glycosyltransferase [Providencia rettgeri]
MTVEVFGLKFKGTDLKKLLSPSDTLKFVVTVNSEFIIDAHKDSSFMEIINSNYSTFDGQIPYFFAKRLVKEKIDKISGSDLIYDILKISSNNKEKVFLLGDNLTVNEQAVKIARECFGSDCYGYSPPFEPYPFSEKSNIEILDKIKDIKPYYLFVAFGAKKQEFWIEENKVLLEKYGVRFVVGCGGSISFLAQKINRAPKFIQSLGLESVYRLMQEPKLFRLKRLIKSFLFFRYIGK